MAYILMVNAEMFSNPLGDGSNPLGISYVVISLLTGRAKKPKPASLAVSAMFVALLLTH